MTTIADINTEWLSTLPHSFGGKYHAYEHYPDVGRKVIEEAFAKNDIYSKFKPYKKPKNYNPVYVWRKRQLFQADVIKFTDPLMSAATGMPNLLVIIDCYTKMVWLYPLKQITGKEVAKVLGELFAQIQPPQYFQTDAGKEFDNNVVRKLMNRHDVIPLITKGKVKACIAERFNLTIQRLIYQRCRALNTNKWTSPEVLGAAKEIYLNRKHRTIGMTPLQAEHPDRQQDLREVYYKRYIDANEKRKKAKFKVGDTVRISATRTAFQRGYHTYFTEEVWKVSEVLTNLPQPRYKVEDLNGEMLDCVLNENELVAYTPTDNVWKVDRIVGKRKKKNGKGYEVKVRWLHWGPQHDSWEPEENIQDLPQKE